MSAKKEPAFEDFFFVISRGKKSGRPPTKHSSGRNDILTVVQATWLGFYLKCSKIHLLFMAFFVFALKTWFSPCWLSQGLPAFPFCSSGDGISFRSPFHKGQPLLSGRSLAW
jgi:hypothetical protein